jgi:SsrA-binding protein
MSKKSDKNPHSNVIRNKRARFDYELGDIYTVGIELTGKEAKSLRLKHGQIMGAYVTIKNNELFLINASIHGTKGIPITDEDVSRTRKLLAKRKEIDQIISAKQQGRSIVPLEIITTGRFIKLRIALGKGKKHQDKRQTIKERDDSRSINRELKSRNY